MLEQAGMLDAAFTEYRMTVERNPGDFAAYTGFRRVALLTGHQDSLVQTSRRLAVGRPDVPEYRIGLLEGLLAMRRTAEALTEARGLASTWPARLPDVAGVLADGGEREAAVDYYLRARSQIGDSSAYSEQLLSLHERRGDAVRAAVELVRIVNRNRSALPGLLPWLSALARGAAQGRLLAECGRIRWEPERVRAQAEVYLANARAEEAVRVMRAGADAQSLYRFGHECEAAERLDAALLVFAGQDAKSDHARVLRKMGRVDEAAAVLAGLDTPTAKLELGNLYLFARRDFPAAAKAFADVLRRQPDCDDALYGLAAAEVAMGRLADAAARLEQVRDSSDRFLLLAARLYLYRHKPDSVRASVSLLAARHPTSPLVNDGLELALVADTTDRAEALIQAMQALDVGEYDDAVDRARRLMAGEDVTAELAHLVGADALSKAGRPRGALVLLGDYRARFAQGKLRPRVMLEEAVILRDGLGDVVRYREALDALIMAFPDSPYAPVARGLLEQAVQVAPAGGLR
ncbi:MAG: tetratricopeptide repeat protein [bacterium]